VQPVSNLSSQDVRTFRENIQAWWFAAAPGSHKLLSNVKWLPPGLLQYSTAGQILAAAEWVPQIVIDSAFRRNL